ncbi:MAG: hypothetical protein ACYC2I_01185 [Elusimicrobiales bacterium]
MNDNLPEIGFKEKKEKKGGAIGWIRGKLGLGSRGAMGEAGLAPNVMNVGRAVGGAKFGASSSGIAGLLAGKLGTVLTVAVMAGAVGTTLYMRSQDTSPTAAAFNSDSAKASSEYVPAILRSQAANQGSSLDMFKDTNKGAGLAMETDPSKANKPPEAKAEAAEDAQAQDPNQPAPDQQNMAGDMMGKLQGGDMASLTSSLGGGSNKFSNMGGFSNKFGSGATGAKAGFSSGIGSGFSSMPKFDARKNKMMAMKSSARPVFGGSKAGKRGTFGSGAYNQAKGLRATQKQFSGTSIDSARSTQDKAWEGATGDGEAGGGAGISDGGAGIVTSPSLDNVGNSGGGGGSDTPDASAPDASAPTDVSPWASDLSTCMMLVLLSCILSFIGAKLCESKVPWIYWLGVVLICVAMALAAAAMVMAIKVMGSQKLLGGLYLIGGGLALAAAIMAFSGKTKGTENSNMTQITWLAAGGGIISMMGSMFAGK